MEYEVKHNGKGVGTLRVEREGLMTVFEARTRRLEGVQRLWVCGEDKCAYLGVLIPAGTELCLRRRLSRRDMSSLPERILYAATAEPKPPARRAADTQTEKPVTANAGRNGAAVTSATAPENREPCRAASRREAGLVWKRASMGTLVARRDGVIYTAIPSALRRGTAGVRVETIDGREYIIFGRSG